MGFEGVDPRHYTDLEFSFNSPDGIHSLNIYGAKASECFTFNSPDGIRRLRELIISYIRDYFQFP